jgi:pilus assembly protein Flp/PilA
MEASSAPRRLVVTVSTQNGRTSRLGYTESKMDQLMHKIVALKNDRKAVTALEYGIIAGVLGLALIGIFKTFGTTLSTLFSNIGGSI